MGTGKRRGMQERKERVEKMKEGGGDEIKDTSGEVDLEEEDASSSAMRRREECAVTQRRAEVEKLKTLSKLIFNNLHLGKRGGKGICKTNDGSGFEGLGLQSGKVSGKWGTKDGV